MKEIPSPMPEKFLIIWRLSADGEFEKYETERGRIERDQPTSDFDRFARKLSANKPKSKK
jgi:hypothetical protein